MRSRAHNNSGFTLIEMIVALSIFSSLMAVLMFGYSQGLSMWERATRHTAMWQSLEHRYGLLSSLFMQVQVVEYVRVRGTYVPHFKGTPQKVEFVSRAPLFALPGHTRVVALSFERQANNSHALIYREAHRRSDPSRGIDWGDQAGVRLLENIEATRIRFEAPVFPLPDELSAADLDAGERQRYRSKPEWVERFDGDWMWRVPQRIQLDFVDADGVPQQWTFGLAAASDAWSLGVYSDD